MATPMTRSVLSGALLLSLGVVAHSQSYPSQSYPSQSSTDGAAPPSTRGRVQNNARPDGQNGPFGVWRTKTDQALVRVEPCNGSICGYALDNSGRRGERVLMDMRPAGGNRWVGVVADVRSGQRYDSRVSMPAPDQLHVEGCVFGGMFCGGETWTRVNQMAQRSEY